MSVRRRLMSQSAIIFAARIGGAGVMFGTQAVIARVWGSALLGDYLVAIAVANLLAMTLPLGFQTIGTYFAADYAAHGDGRSLRRFLLQAYGHIIVPGLLLLTIAGMLAPNWGDAGERLAALWLPVSILATGTAIIYVNGAVLVGLKRPFAGFFADTIFRPLIVISAFLVTAFLLSDGDNVKTMFWVIALAYLAIALVHFGLTIRSASRIEAAPSSQATEWRRWWYFALPWVVISLATDFFFDVDLLLLSTMFTPEQIAVFGVCTRIFVLAAFGVSAVYAVSVPGLMEDGANKDIEGLAAKIGDANLVASGLSLVLLVLIGVLGPFVLALFGEAFTVGLVPLLILCASLMVRSVFGPSSLILSAHNYPYANLPAIGVILISLVIGNFILVPAFGLVGAAMAAFLSLLLGALVLWVTTLKLTGIDVSIVPGLKQLFARSAR